MKILVSSFTFPPQVNGVAEVTRVHVEHFLKRGHEVTVATTFDPARETNAGESQPAVFQFRIEGIGNLRDPYRGEIQNYQQFIRQWKGDVIFCHCWQSWCTDLAVPMFKFTSARKVLVSHGFTAHAYPKLARFPRGLGRWLAWRPHVWQAVGKMKQFDRVVFLSDIVNRGVYYDHWLAKKHKLQNTCVIPTGVHAEEFAGDLPNFRSSFGIGERQMVLCLSNYDPLKNQLMAVKAFSRARVAGSVLVVVGKVFNDYTDELRAWCKQAGETTRVLFLEKLDRRMVRAAYYAADVFVCPSLWESGPLILLEAMAAETPFVSTDVGFASRLPGGVVVADEEAMASGIRRLLLYGELRAKLGKQGREACVSTYNWPVIMERYDALLESVSEGRQKPPSER